jgi:hypothetical protein
MWKAVFFHKDIVKLSYDFVAVVAHGNSDHGEADFKVSGQKVHSCSVYSLPDCKTHEDMRNALAQKSLAKDVSGTPTHIIYNPKDMTEISRSHFQSVSQMTDSIAEAQKIIGKPITWKAFSKMTKSLDEAEKFIAEEDYRKAAKALKGFDAEGMASLEQRAEKLRGAITEAGTAQLEKAREMLAEGNKSGALKLLRDIARDFAGTDLEDEAKTLMVEAKQED